MSESRAKKIRKEARRLSGQAIKDKVNSDFAKAMRAVTEENEFIKGVIKDFRKKNKLYGRIILAVSIFAGLVLPWAILYFVLVFHG